MRRPMVDAAVSDHERLLSGSGNVCVSRGGEDSRHDCDHGDIPRIDSQRPRHTDQVPHHAIHRRLFTLPHQRTEDGVVRPRKGWRTEPEQVDEVDKDACRCESTDEGPCR